ncbi:nuclease-related domain-containing protein [Nonomuraea sp. NPDC050663]|uniref:nuclease-related domain-containing protein n=1 Tax=Nonomuraea sp. NPDC050663 TaxID=3364370 RepID=UPI00379835C9
MVNFTPRGAGASAHARYRAEQTADRLPRLILRTLLAALVGLAALVPFGWKLGLLAAAVVVVADIVVRWRAGGAASSWRRGAIGERRTARHLRILTRLGYTVLHDRALPRGRANVDHLVVGPTGVFVIDSKMWRRDQKIRGGGRWARKGRVITPSDVRSLLYETRSVAGVLGTAGRPVQVVAVLAVHGPHVPWRGQVVHGAQVLRPSLLTSWILDRPKVYDKTAVEHLALAAERAFPPYVQ